ncbi:MAG TPA: hypothetical protein VG013_10470 [Gemmataceae bacterium]|jgi:hypothetical protein|nr:hypothetical protein [Gemmataceae bacterium]
MTVSFLGQLVDDRRAAAGGTATAAGCSPPSHTASRRGCDSEKLFFVLTLDAVIQDSKEGRKGGKQEKEQFQDIILMVPVLNGTVKRNPAAATGLQLKAE